MSSTCLCKCRKKTVTTVTVTTGLLSSISYFLFFPLKLLLTNADSQLWQRGSVAA